MSGVDAMTVTHEYAIDAKQGLIVERWTGEVTLDALVRGLAELEREPTFDPAFDVLADYSHARLALSRDDLKLFQLEVRKRDWTDVGRRAVVTPGDFEFGVSRQAQGLWQVEGLMVCRTEQEALAWLGHGPDDD